MYKISKEDHGLIISKYRDELVPMAQLALHFSVTRQYIYKLLKNNGIDTKKRKMTVPCDCCGKIVHRPRCQVRNHKHHFCSVECYYAWLESLSEGPYVQNRHSQRLARAIVSQFFDLQPEHVIHHQDRNNFNNEIWNLAVFASQADHMRYHRGLEVQLLWSGVKLPASLLPPFEHGSTPV